MKGSFHLNCSLRLKGRKCLSKVLEVVLGVSRNKDQDVLIFSMEVGLLTGADLHVKVGGPNF